MDFGGFLEASWEGKWSQNRSKKASKKRWKNESHQDGQKIEIRRNNGPRHQGSKAMGDPREGRKGEVGGYQGLVGLDNTPSDMNIIK